MKKFDRLPPEKRKEEIKAAALKLFNSKGFSKTTMESIVSQVSLSKGGVYRLYKSTTDILSDIIIDGMRLRNDFYAEKIKERIESGQALNIDFVAEVICESLFLYPEISNVYVEFLWAKRRNEKLQKLYKDIYSQALEETLALLSLIGSEDTFKFTEKSLANITDVMNGAILAIDVLDLRDKFSKNQETLTSFISKSLREIEEQIS